MLGNVGLLIHVQKGERQNGGCWEKVKLYRWMHGMSEMLMSDAEKAISKCWMLALVNS